MKHSSQYEPGEWWTTDYRPWLVKAWVLSKTGIRNTLSIAQCHGPNAGANALLIAAAPELLEALEACATTIEEYARQEEIDPGDQESFRMACEALAKAKGEGPDERPQQAT